MARGMNGGSDMRRAFRRQLIGYAFVSPWLIGFLVFTLMLKVAVPILLEEFGARPEAS